MAKAPGTADVKRKLDGLTKSIKDKKWDKTIPKVGQFVEDLKQLEQEDNDDLIIKKCEQFDKELLDASKFEGAKQSDIDSLKTIFQGFILPRVAKSAENKGKFSETIGTVPSHGKGPVNIEVKSLSQTYKVADSNANSTVINVTKGTGNPAEKTDTENSNLLEKRRVELEEIIKERDGLDQKVQELLKAIEQRDHEIENKKEMIGKFETEAQLQYSENLKIKQENDEFRKNTKEMNQENKFLKQREHDLKSEVEEKTEQWNIAIEQFEEASRAMEQSKKKVTHLEDTIKAMKRQNEERVQKLISERDDLRNRYSKVAGEKLKDNNSDISDLSDPNRPMKLGEKFSELYDNEWTDAFDAQTDKLKKNEKDAIKFLLDALQDCYSFCKEIAERQMTELRNVFLYNCQDMTKPVTKDKPRLHSNQENALLEVRKTIAATRPEPVKQQFLEKMKGNPDEKCPKEITAYYEKCTEICWLLAVHNPPLYMDTEFKLGTKIDSNLYTTYYTPGDKTDFLVWPPLYNVKNGGLINKGVMAPVQEKKKIKK